MTSSVWNLQKYERSSLADLAFEQFDFVDSSLVTITVGGRVYEDDEIISYSTSYGKASGPAGFTVPTATVDLIGEHPIASDEPIEIKTSISYKNASDTIRFRGIVGQQSLTRSSDGVSVTRLLCTSASVRLAKSKFQALLDPSKSIAEGLHKVRLAMPYGASLKMGANFSAQDRFYIPTGLTFVDPSDIWPALERNAISVDHHRDGEIVVSPGYAHESHRANPMWESRPTVTADDVIGGFQIEQPQSFIESAVSVKYRTGSGVKVHSHNIYHKNNRRPDLVEEIDISEDIVYNSSNWEYAVRLHMANRTGTLWASGSLEFDLMTFKRADKALLDSILSYHEGDFMILDRSISNHFSGKKYILGFSETLSHDKWSMRFNLVSPVIAYGSPAREDV